MKGNDIMALKEPRIRLHEGAAVSFETDYERLVDEPARKGYYAEAFANLSAMIEEELFSVLRQVHRSAGEQQLVSQFSKVARVDALKVAEMLVAKKIITKQLYEKINHFRRHRNIVLHTIEGYYGLAMQDKWWTRIKTQEQLDAEAERKANESLRQGKEAYFELVKVAELLQ